MNTNDDKKMAAEMAERQPLMGGDLPKVAAERAEMAASRPEIMCTLTGAQILHEQALVAEMLCAGMDAVRINTAHLDTTAALAELAKGLKALSPTVKILIDTKGPEMRTTMTAGDAPVTLRAGQRVAIEGTDQALITSRAKIYVNFPAIHEYARPGQTLLIDDGRIALTVEELRGRTITALVEHDALLGARKGFAISGVDVPLPAVSQHDRLFIAYAAAAPEIDVIAHSFVRSAADVEAVREAMGGHAKPIIAKIENQQGLDRLDEILAVADGVLIARGDLTASLGAAAVPAAQQRIAEAAKAVGRPLYLATNILPSMMTQEEPSEADLEGIRLALRQGVDVLLLTNETAAGEHPLAATRALREARSALRGAY